MTKRITKIEKTEEQWRELLTPEQYRITREKGTERAFDGRYHDTKTPGTYTCVCCSASLFDSETKYDSGSGWPSFFQPIGSEQVEMLRDEAHGMVRTEVQCARCGAHLGHVFNDGPKPTGMRYCINSASLELKPPDGDST